MIVYSSCASISAKCKSPPLTNELLRPGRQTWISFLVLKILTTGSISEVGGGGGGG